MIESPGKKVARTRLYGCLRDWLTEEQILSGRYLVLLGEDARELPFLDDLGIPRDRITCVERRPEIFSAICAIAAGVHVTQTDMAEFLDSYLHDDNRFLVLNLDIEGQYRMQLDPAMSSVLLYCCRNPQTVVATYNTIGRDLHTVWEGVASLATLLWLAPGATEHLLSCLHLYYKDAGYETPIKCALRDLFWIRSLLEHTLRVSGVICPEATKAFALITQTSHDIWQAIRAQPRRTLVLDHVRNAAKQIAPASTLEALLVPSIHVQVPEHRHVIYKAVPPWSQRCFFNKFRLTAEPISPIAWLESTIQAFHGGQFEFVDRDGVSTIIQRVFGPYPLLCDRTVLESGSRIFAEFTPRSLDPMHPERWLKTIQRIHLDLQLEREGMAKKKASPANKGKATEEVVDRAGRLTGHGKSRCRLLAAQGLDSAEILVKLKLGVNDPNAGSIRAFVAHARRPAEFAAGTNGKLSEYGLTFIAGLVEHGKTFEEVDSILHKSIDRDEARKAFNRAKRA